MDYVAKSDRAFRDIPQIAVRALREIAVRALREWETIQRKKEADRSLRESERKFREFAEFLPGPVFETDEQGYVTFASLGGLEVFGFTKEDLAQGIHMSEVFAEQDKGRIQEKFR